MMRRARLQVKPNIGPKPGARPPDTPTKSKPATPVTATRPAPSTTPTSHDSKTDNSTQPKSSDNRTTVDSTVHASAPQTSAHHEGDKVASDKTAQSSKAHSTLAPKSPRKSVDAERVKLSVTSAKSGHGKGDVSSGVAIATPLSPGRIRSPRKSVGSDQPHVPPKSPGAVSLSASNSSEKAADNSSVKTSGNATAGAIAGTDHASPTKVPAASNSKPSILGRGIRSRFTKVKPNLAEAGKRAPKIAAVAEKKTAEDAPDGGTVRAEKATEVEQEKEKRITVADGTELSQSSEKTADNSDAQSEISTSDQQALQSQLSNTDSVGGEENADAASEVGSCSQVSTDRETENGPGDASLDKVDSDGFAVPEEPKKAAGEKKARRLKPSMPSPEAQLDRSMMKMSDLIYWNPSRNRMQKKETKLPQPSASGGSQEKSDVPSAISTDDEASNESDSMPVPQLKIGPDGNIILNMESLVMDNKAGDPTQAQMETIEEDDDRFITCSSFREKQRQKRWSQWETERFFRALSQVGTDFSLMSKLFPSRSRRDLKNKFCKEEKRNRPRIDKALRERQPFDRKTFERAAEEEENEKRRKEAKEADKKKKRRKNLKREMEEDDDEEDDDEDMESSIEEGEREERKENSQKRQIKKLHQDGGTFPPYKKTKRGRAAAAHTSEVAEILMNMSQGKMAAGKDDMDDSASDVSSVDSAPFVPKVARRKRTPVGSRPFTSSKSVIVDSIPDLTVSPNTGSNPTSVRDSNMIHINQLSKNCPADQNDSSDIGEASAPDNNSAVLNTAVLPPVGTIAVPGGQTVNIASFIEGLQAQTSTPVDVVLVEQQGEGEQQGLVHVYLVPRAQNPATEGGEGNSLQGESGGGSGGDIGVEQSMILQVQGGETNSQSHRTTLQGTETQNRDISVLQTEGGERNSLPIMGDAQNVHNILNDTEAMTAQYQGGEKNSQQQTAAYPHQMMINENTISQNQGLDATKAEVVSIEGQESVEETIVIDEETWNCIQSEAIDTSLSNSAASVVSGGHRREVVDLTADDITLL